MFGQEHALQDPVFFFLALISGILTIGYFWGKGHNKKLFLALFDELIDVIKPEDQTYGNIAGTGEYYSDFSLKKESPLARIDAKFTFLPRHMWPYLPVAMLIDKYDKLLIALHFKQKLRDEGHIIEADYAKSMTAKIKNIDQLNRVNAKWGKYNYHIYYKSKKTYNRFKGLIDTISDPGGIRHIAFIPNEKKCFIFVVPQKGHLVKELAPIYQGILSRMGGAGNREIPPDLPEDDEPSPE